MVYNFCCRLDRFSCCFGATDTLFAAFKSGLRDGLFLLNILDTKPERVFVRACTHYVKRMQNYNYFFNWQSLPVNFFVFYVEKFLSVAQPVAGVCPLVCRVGMFVWCRAVIPSFKVRSWSVQLDGLRTGEVWVNAAAKPSLGSGAEGGGYDEEVAAFAQFELPLQLCG